MIHCKNCDSSKFDLILTDNYKVFFNSLQINADKLFLQEPYNFSNTIAKLIIDKTNKINRNNVLEDINMRSNVFKKIICKKCKTTLYSDSLNPNFTSIYSSLYNSINENILNFLSIKSKIKIDTFAFPVEGRVLFDHLISLVKRIDKKIFKKYFEAEKNFSYFSPQIGGPSYDLLNDMLFLLGFNIFCNFIHDLIKFGSKKIRQKYNDKKIIEEIRESIDSEFEQIKNPPPWIPIKDKMNVNLYGIIASMPEKKKEQILDDIAIQHAINVKNELLDMMSSTDE